jgi:hypothetical protein
MPNPDLRPVLDYGACAHRLGLQDSIIAPLRRRPRYLSPMDAGQEPEKALDAKSILYPSVVSPSVLEPSPPGLPVARRDDDRDANRSASIDASLSLGLVAF